MPEAAHRTTWTEETLAALQDRGHRNSAARRAVIELLGRQRCCLTVQEIFDQLRAEGRRVGIASVYRALEQLTRGGYVQRIEVGAGSARFEPVHGDGEHHHHLVCDDCGRVESFSDVRLERALESVERQVGYAIAGHEVVLHGECASCATSVSR
jgi:Fur family ferric uptake transcriptional regulator